MGGVGIADHRLFDAVADGKLNPSFALYLLDTQAGAAEATGHVLALNDEYVWRRITGPSSREVSERIWVRCIFCGCLAHLFHWARVAKLSPGERERYRTYARQRGMESMARYLLECDGEQNTRQLRELLTGWTPDNGPIVTYDPEEIPF